MSASRRPLRAAARMGVKPHAGGDRQGRKRQPVPLRADRVRAAGRGGTADAWAVHDRGPRPGGRADQGAGRPQRGRPGVVGDHDAHTAGRGHRPEVQHGEVGEVDILALAGRPSADGRLLHRSPNPGLHRERSGTVRRDPRAPWGQGPVDAGRRQSAGRTARSDTCRHRVGCCPGGGRLSVLSCGRGGAPWFR